jgi:CrcB protein
MFPDSTNYLSPAISGVLVFLGGGIGSVARYALSLAIKNARWNFPYATLCANALACFLVGLLVPLIYRNQLTDNWKLLFITGICGGLSTFSTFTLETRQLWNQGLVNEVFLNVFINLTVCFGCLLLGTKLTT